MRIARGSWWLVAVLSVSPGCGGEVVVDGGLVPDSGDPILDAPLLDSGPDTGRDAPGLDAGDTVGVVITASEGGLVTSSDGLFEKMCIRDSFATA